MGHTLAYANRMNLAAMAPHSELASSKYCLANPGEEYLVYLPLERRQSESRRFLRRLKQLVGSVEQLLKPTVTVNLATASGQFLVEWFDPVSGAVKDGKPLAGGASRSFTAPFRGEAVLYLRHESWSDKGR
jgi:hypothetical protein